MSTLALRTNLLTAEDLVELQTYGCRATEREDLYVRGINDSVCLTLKGIQYYQAACATHGVPTRVQEIRTAESLLSLKKELISACVGQKQLELESLFQRGDVPQELQETVGEFLYGSPDSWRASVTRRQEFQKVGGNVIGANFNKKRLQHLRVAAEK